MPNYISAIKLPNGDVYQIKDNGALQLTGGQVTGPVNFGDSVYINDLNAGTLIVTGNAAFTNNIQANTINGVEVGPNPKFTDTGTVTSVAVAATSNSGITISGSPIISAGTITIDLNLNTAINKQLSEGTADADRDNYAIVQQADGLATYHRRKLSNVFAALNSTDITNALGGTQNANFVFAGPSSGSAATPSFRALVEADIPGLAWSKITSGNDDLKAIEALTGTSGLLKKTAANTWSLDTNTYLTATTLPTAASDVLGGIKIGYTTSGKKYPVQLDSNSKAYVQVPWTDNNTTYTAGTGLTLNGTTFNHSNSIAAGTAGTSSATSSTNRQIAIPYVTYDTQGHITASGTHTHTIESFPEAYLTWGGKNFSASYGPIDAAMIPQLGANRFAFLKPAGIEIEYSTDEGESWNDYEATDDQKVALFSTSGFFHLGKAATKANNNINNMLRITITTNLASIYTTLNKIAIYMSTQGNTTWVKIERATHAAPTDYITHLDWTQISGWSGWNILNISGLTTYGNSSSQNQKVRFVFKQTSVSANYSSPGIWCIYGFGGVGWTVPSNMAKNGHLYSYDSNQNATFPAQITATQFNGNATSASSLTNKTLDSSTIDRTAGSFTFQGSAAQGAGTDWVGLQVDSGSDKFQIHALNSTTLQYRQNDSGGTNSNWSDWQSLLSSGNYTDYTVTKNGTGATGTWGIDITGNADTATKAEQDESGNNIKTNYASSLSVSGTTFTLKSKSDASLSTVALTSDNIPSLNASKITDGILPVARGGTGKASFSAGYLLYTPTTGSIESTKFMHLNYKAGTTSTLGYEELILGNTNTEGITDNAFGRIGFYSAKTKGSYITAADTTNSSWYDHVLPASAGWIVTGGSYDRATDTATGVGSDTIPIYVSTAGRATEITKVDVAHGGTGVTSFTANSLIMSGTSTTAALTTRAISTIITVDNSTNIPTEGAVKTYVDNQIATIQDTIQEGYVTIAGNAQQVTGRKTLSNLAGASFKPAEGSESCNISYNQGLGALVFSFAK